MSRFGILKSFTLVVVQFLCLGLIAATGPLFPANVLLLAVEFSGLGLGIWAVLTMGLGNFNVAPDPLRWSRLVTHGPYRLIRHPMYLSLLLITLPLVGTDFSGLRLEIWLVLLADLLLKLNYEEDLLAARLTGYCEYQHQSYRLIPFVY